MSKLACAGVLAMVVMIGALSSSHAQVPKVPEEGVLIGKWKVRCPLGHDDIVEKLTKEHTCSKGNHPSVVKGTAMVVCPDGHPNPVANATKGHLCWIDKKECRLD